jgi:hypothetical protein
MTVAVWILGSACLLLAFFLYRMSAKHGRLLVENHFLKDELEKATHRLAEVDAGSGSGGLFQRAVAALVGLGVPGLVLLAVMAVSGFSGAAAITSALAALGGPVGMLGGIALLVAIGLTSKALTEYGFPVLAEAVVRGLLKKGESKESIRSKIDGIPRWAVSSEVRSRILQVLNGVS